MADQAQVLRSNELFKSFDDDVLNRFIAAAETRSYKAEDVIFAEMTEGDEVFLVVEGEVTIQFALANEEDQFEIVTVGPGEILGEVSFIEEGQRSATAIAVADVSVLAWKCSAWRAICEEDAAVGYQLVMGIARILCRRLKRWNVRMLNQVSWGLE